MPDAVIKWYEIGLELLGLEGVAALKAILLENHKDFRTCATKMFKKWLERNMDASWNQLIQILRKPAIDLSFMSSRIENMLLKDDMILKGIANCNYICE